MVGKTRSAFTLIELVFAIVVISIAVMSLPVMVRITSDQMESNIVQEAVFAASAELTGALAYYWDRRSMEDMYDNNLTYTERVIDINGTCNSDRLRIGHISQPYHRRCLESSNSSVNYDLEDNGSIANLNGTIHSSRLIFTDGTKDQSGYKNNYYSTLSVSKGLNDDDIKKITITASDSDGKVLTELKAYSANIGEVEFYKRRF